LPFPDGKRLPEDLVMALITAYGLEIPQQALSLEGFREWLASLGESAPRMCFTSGRLHIEISPQDYKTHGPVADAINDVLVGLTKERDLGRYFRAPNWFTDQASALSTEPDGFLVQWASIESGRVRINPERTSELLGRPDMVLEVVSKSSRKKDTVELVEDYAAAGIGEYWIADAMGPRPDLQILTLGTSSRYTRIEPDAEGWLQSPLWRAAFRLVRGGDRGEWVDYRLERR
jgi:Uma2 family endonuclease